MWCDLLRWPDGEVSSDNKSGVMCGYKLKDTQLDIFSGDLRRVSPHNQLAWPCEIHLRTRTDARKHSHGSIAHARYPVPVETRPRCAYRCRNRASSRGKVRRSRACGAIKSAQVERLVRCAFICIVKSTLTNPLVGGSEPRRSPG